jgi:hypothetical protein
MMISYHMILSRMEWYDMIWKLIPQGVYFVVCRDAHFERDGSKRGASLAPHNPARNIQVLLSCLLGRGMVLSSKLILFCVTEKGRGTSRLFGSQNPLVMLASRTWGSLTPSPRKERRM